MVGLRRPGIAARLGGIASAGAAAWLAVMMFPLCAYCFPWSIDMYRGPAVQPESVAPRVMPAGTLPVNTGMPRMNLEQMTLSMHNPFKPTPARLAHGKDLFSTDCAPCHGETGVGDGPVAHLLQHKPANLVSGVSKNLPDGYIYGYIRNGGVWMPSYGDAMSSDERWDVVMYIRNFQAAASSKAKAASSAR